MIAPAFAGDRPRPPALGFACGPGQPPGTSSMRVVLAGGSGLIGRHLVRKLIARGDRPVILTRQADKARLSPSLRGAEVIQGDPTVSGGWETAVDGCDAAINLVGH